MEEPKSYSVIIVPSDHSGTRQFRISRTMVFVGVAVAALGTIVILTFAVTHLSVLRTASRVGQLEEENEQLREDVARVDELAGELEFLSAQRAQILNMLGSTEFEVAEELGGSEGFVEREDPLADAERVQQLFADGARRPYAPREWPVDGDVRREFLPGTVGDEGAHPGLTISVSEGELVRASGGGRVVVSELDDEGNPRLVLDHGYGFRTVYAGFARPLVGVGQIVERGRPVAEFDSMGSVQRSGAGRDEGPALYFEIRVDGAPIDPREYLTPRQGRRRGS